MSSLKQRPLRIGVCGTGFWAKAVHLPALVASSDVKLAGVWGRSDDKCLALAREFSTSPYADFESMLDQVDAVSFALPPDLQASMALRAAKAGKHLLLEKPIATTLGEADRLVEAVQDQGVATVTFLTKLFVDEAHALIARARAGGSTRCKVTWKSGALLPGTPFTDSGWRSSRYGTLWDLGPHVLSILVPVLGPIARIEARRLRQAKFSCRMWHPNGSQSTVALDQMDETVPRGSHEHYVFSGHEGTVEGGGFAYKPVDCYTRALRVLIESIGSGVTPLGLDIRYGRDIVAALEAACSSIESGGKPIELNV